jgi:hypothetical protein
MDMNKKLLLLPIFVLLVLFSVNLAAADVLIEDTQMAASAFNPGFTDRSIQTGVGQPGNYVIISCATANPTGNTFNDLTPGTWDLLDEGSCGGAGQLCLHGIWGRFEDMPNSEFITCSWTESTTVWAAGTIRYSNVDPDSPIIGVDCETGLGTELIAPSIITEAGSQVLRVYTSGAITHAMTQANPAIANKAFPEGGWAAPANSDSQHIRSEGISALTLVAGPTGTDSVTVEIPSQWRACTIALRMDPNLRFVPTMNEWGLISFPHLRV